MNATYRRLLCRFARPLIEELAWSLERQADRYQIQADYLRDEPGTPTGGANESYRLGLASGYRAGAYLLRNTASGMPL